jgi:hypothetical protein
MGHATPSASLTHIALERLDHLIGEVKHAQGAQTDLLLEHLQGARIYLLGAMPDEYEFSLHEARRLAPQAANFAVQKAIEQDVGVLLEQIPPGLPQPQIAPVRRSEPKTLDDAAKSKLYRFFKGSATTLGVFYPTHYIFASFPSLEHAKNAAKALEAAGFIECLSASSAETFLFMNEIRSEVGIWGILMASISRFFGTEEVFADIDLAKIEDGAAFLAVYCRREEHAERIRDLVMPFEPIAMQLYLPGGIRSLIAGKSPGPQGNYSR